MVCQIQEAGHSSSWPNTPVGRVLRSALSPHIGLISEDGALFGTRSIRFSLFDSRSLKPITQNDVLRFRVPNQDLSQLLILSVSQEAYVPTAIDMPLVFGQIHVLWDDRRMLVFQSPGASLLSGYLDGHKNVLFAALVDLRQRGKQPNFVRAIPLPGQESIWRISIESLDRRSVLLRILRSIEGSPGMRTEAYRLDPKDLRLTPAKLTELQGSGPPLTPGHFSGSDYRWEARGGIWETVRQGYAGLSTEPFVLCAVSANRRFALVANRSNGETWVLEASPRSQTP